MSDFNPCRMCGLPPIVCRTGLMWMANHCGEVVEAFTESECAAKWNRLNPVEVRYANDSRQG